MNSFYVYILESLKDNNFYIGCTKDLNKRLKEHNTGKAVSTKHRKPFNLIYYEVCFNREDAYRREKYLKSGYGHKWIKTRLSNFLLKK